MSDTTIHRGGGNVFEDLCLPNASDALLKSSIVIELRRLMEAQGMTQTAAARQLGMGQANLSKLLGGHFRGYSVDRLMRMLTAFGQDVDIVARPRRQDNDGSARISFKAVAG